MGFLLSAGKTLTDKNKQNIHSNRNNFQHYILFSTLNYRVCVSYDFQELKCQYFGTWQVLDLSLGYFSSRCHNSSKILFFNLKKIDKDGSYLIISDKYRKVMRNQNLDITARGSFKRAELLLNLSILFITFETGE